MKDGPKVGQRFILGPDSPQALESLLQFLGQRNPDIRWVVMVEPYHINRTVAQNALLWAWHTIYGNEFGYTKEEQHNRFKWRHVRPILLRDNDPDGRLAGLIALAEGSPLRKEMLETITEYALSTTMLSTKQFSEALDEYDRRTATEGLTFPHPEDRYREAMEWNWREDAAETE